MTPSVMMDLTLAVMLMISIAYCWRLERQLNKLRSGRDQMMAATSELAQTIAHAEATIASLRAASDAAALQAAAEPPAAPSRPQPPAAGLRRRMTT